MEINIEDYVSESQIREAILDTVISKTAEVLKDENSIKRIIDNTCYDFVYKMVDDSFDGELKKHMKARIRTIISKMTLSSVIAKPNAWDREQNDAYKFYQKCVVDNFPKIKEIVDANIEQVTLSELKSGLSDYIVEAIQGLFVNLKEKDETN